MNWFQIFLTIIVVIITAVGLAVFNDYLVYRGLQRRLEKERKRKEFT